MRLLYFSPDGLEVEQIGKELTAAGIPCEVRNASARIGIFRNGDHPDAELWIRHDKDAHRASLLCVQLGVGFAKRPPRKSWIECWSDLSSRHEWEDEEAEEEAEPHQHSVEELPANGHANGHVNGHVNGARRKHHR